MNWLFRKLRNLWLRHNQDHIFLHVGLSDPEDGWVWVKTPAQAVSYLHQYKVEKLCIEQDLGPDQGGGYGVCQWLESNPQYTPIIVRLRCKDPLIMARMRLTIQKAKALAAGQENRFPYRRASF